MAPTYYVIELSARWLTILLVALALVMVLAFAFGYGAAWSVLTERAGGSGGSLSPAASAATATPVVAEEVILSEPTATRRQTPKIEPTPPPKPTAAAPPPTRAAAAPTKKPDEFWVQVLASSNRRAMEQAEGKLEELGFPAEHHRVTTTQVAGGDMLYKLRVGPFPDRDSADRVARRMRASGYPDAWVVVP